MKTLRICSVLPGLCLLLASCFSEEEGTGTADIVKVGDALPAFSVTTTEGATVSPATLAGRPAVIAFFTTTCPDCRRELPVLQEVYEEMGGVAAFVCIGREEEASVVEAYWRDNGLTLPCSPQADRGVYGLFALRTVPRLYVADAQGTVRNVFVESASKDRLAAAIRQAVGGE